MSIWEILRVGRGIAWGFTVLTVGGDIEGNYTWGLMTEMYSQKFTLKM